MIQIALITTLGAILRFSALGRSSLWLDEYTSLEVASRSFADIIYGRGFDSHTPPFYYLILHCWLWIVPSTEAGLRSLSAVFDVLNIWLLYEVVRRQLSRQYALVACLLYALSPFALYYAQEGRMYSLLAFEALFSYYCILQIAEGSRTWSILLLVVSVCGLYTHYYFALFAGALGFGVFVTYRRDRQTLLRAITPLLIAGICFLPWIGIVIHLAASGGQSFRKFTPVVIPYSFFRFVAGYALMPLNAGAKDSMRGTVYEHSFTIGLYGIAFGAAFVMGMRSLMSKFRRECLMVFSVLLIPPLIALLVSVKSPMFSERYLMVIFPFFVIVFSVAFRSLVGMLPFLLLCVVADVQYFTSEYFGKEQWREVAVFLKANDTGTIVAQPDFTKPILAYYLGGREIKTFRPATFQSEVQNLNDQKVTLVERGGEGSVLDVFAAAGYRLISRSLYPLESGITVYQLERTG